MLYIPDANVLIDANRDYYPISRVPEYWSWLVYQGSLEQIKIPLEILDELKGKEDDLSTWAKSAAVKQNLLLNEEPDPGVVNRVVSTGYASDLNEDDIEKIGRDPFLIAYALVDQTNRVIVTTENSKPKKLRANRKIPDVCFVLDVNCIDAFEMIRTLNFSTNWTLRD